MPDQDSLKNYMNKRNFSVTPEPQESQTKIEDANYPIFVIQKHDATRLHYDFRLEIGGVLKSWSIPKGPSTNPKDKRLAIPTEDHPMSYANFEGVIPEQQYGAGPVIVWDTGTFRNTTEKNSKPISTEQGWEEGHLTFELFGHKLKGEWALTRFKTGEDEAWLLIKKTDNEANPDKDIVKEEPQSVLSGKTIEALKQEK